MPTLNNNVITERLLNYQRMLCTTERQEPGVYTVPYTTLSLNNITKYNNGRPVTNQEQEAGRYINRTFFELLPQKYKNEFPIIQYTSKQNVKIYIIARTVIDDDTQNYARGQNFHINTGNQTNWIETAQLIYFAGDLQIIDLANGNITTLTNNGIKRAGYGTQSFNKSNRIKTVLPKKGNYEVIDPLKVRHQTELPNYGILDLVRANGITRPAFLRRQFIMMFFRPGDGIPRHPTAHKRNRGNKYEVSPSGGQLRTSNNVSRSFLKYLAVIFRNNNRPGIGPNNVNLTANQVIKLAGDGPSAGYVDATQIQKANLNSALRHIRNENYLAAARNLYRLLHGREKQIKHFFESLSANRLAQININSIKNDPTLFTGYYTAVFKKNNIALQNRVLREISMNVN
jgi:hypothetical protein